MRRSRQLLSPSLLSLWGSWLIVRTVARHTAYPSLPFLEILLFFLLILIIAFTKDVFFTTREALATRQRSATRTTSALGSQVEKHGCVTSSNHVASPWFKASPKAGACALGPAHARLSGHCWGRCLRRAEDAEDARAGPGPSASSTGADCGCCVYVSVRVAARPWGECSWRPG